VYFRLTRDETNQPGGPTVEVYVTTRNKQTPMEPILLKTWRDNLKVNH